MAKQRVLIEVSPTRLEVAVLRGEEIAASRAQRLDLPNYTENWPGVLDTIQAPLTAMVNELGITGARATVLYFSPTAATGVFSCAESAGASGAAKAARLALAEAAGFAIESNPHDLERLTTDKPASGEGAAAAQAHTLGIADTEPTAQALAEWVTRAGLEPFALVPIDVPGTIAAVDAALRLSHGSTVALVLFAGEHGSALAAASAGRLRFIRQIGIGTESLVGALARDIRGAGGPVALNHETAAKLIFAAGIPDRAQIFDAERGITGDAVLPLVQPILQRCVVDIKQSMRFGLDEKERESATLHGIGLGARVPRLMALVSEQTGLSIGAPDPAVQAATAGNIAAWLSSRTVLVNLLPRGLRAQMTGRRLRRAMWVGVGVALVLIGADTALTRVNLTQQLQGTGKLKQRLEAAKPANAIQDKLTAAQAGLATAKQHAADRLSAVGNWDAAMAMVARQTPPAIRLTQMHFNFDGGKPTCHLVGHAPLHGQVDSNAALKAYMDALTAAPIVRSCRLGATQRGESEQGPVQNFEMTLVLVELPAQPRSPGAAFSGVGAGEDRP